MYENALPITLMKNILLIVMAITRKSGTSVYFKAQSHNRSVLAPQSSPGTLPLQHTRAHVPDLIPTVSRSTHWNHGTTDCRPTLYGAT